MKDLALIKFNSQYFNVKDTLECGQCFRHELIRREGGYSEYIIPIGKSLVRVGERKRGELLFFDTDEKEVRTLLIPYFTLDVDYGKIKADVLSHTDSEWMMRAAEAAEGTSVSDGSSQENP
jgi:N-glycosylase/DNA lyase